VNFAGNTGTQFTTHPSRDLGPVWSPDGTRIAFASDRDGAYNLYQKPTKGAAEETLLRSAESKIPTSWSHDGRYLLYTVTDPKTNDDVWVLRLEDRKPAPLLQTKFDESDAQFSPDGRWIAYVSNESGRSEVYVQPFSPNAPGAEGKWMFSRGGGTNPKWAANGKEIRYLNSDHHVISVDVVAAAGFQVGQQHDLFALPRGVFAFDFASDGRVLAALPMTQNTASMLTVVLNWQAGLKK